MSWIDQILNSQEFKDFRDLVAKQEGRTVDSVSIGPGYILVDGYRYCVPMLNAATADGPAPY